MVLKKYEGASLASKTLAIYRSLGPAATVRQVLMYLLNKPRFAAFRIKAGLNRWQFGRLLARKDPEIIFCEIHSRNSWGSQESRSGPGSEVSATNSVRAHLPAIFETFLVKSILDAPCGDFNWMKLVDFPDHISYTGADIVRSVVDESNSRYGSPSRKFIALNISRDPLPSVDLLLCRDCLFHLSYEDIFSTLNNFLSSEIRLLLTTSHNVDADHSNSDIRTGDCRNIDLFKPPFCFPREVLYRIEEDDGSRQLCLWSREQILQALREAGTFKQAGSMKV